jgi:hypothetical protein
MAPGGSIDCLTSFDATCMPGNVSSNSTSTAKRLTMPLSGLESGPAYLLLLAISSAIYLLMVFAIRLFLRLKINGPFGKDDWTCAISTFFGLVYSVIVVVQVFLGLGSILQTLSPAEANTMAILGWANGFCLTLAGYFSKMSACFMLARITKTREHLAVAYALMAAMTMWMLQAQIYAIFQCKHPRPWDTSPKNTCYDQVSCCYYFHLRTGHILNFDSGAIGSPLLFHHGSWSLLCSPEQFTWFSTSVCPSRRKRRSSSHLPCGCF